MKDNGLANAMMDTEAAAAPQDEMALILEEVIRLLSEGVSPEELIAMGVPPEIIEEAMTVLQTPTPKAAPAQAAVPNDGGLASVVM